MARIKPAPPTKDGSPPKGAASFRRILVRKIGSTTYTTVSVSAPQYAVMQRLAYNLPALVNSTLRNAASAVPQDTPRTKFSSLVRKKAVNILRGSYRPEVSAAATPACPMPDMTSLYLMAEANNKAWDAVAVAGALVNKGEQA